MGFRPQRPDGRRAFRNADPQASLPRQPALAALRQHASPLLHPRQNRRICSDFLTAWGDWPPRNVFAILALGYTAGLAPYHSIEPSGLDSLPTRARPCPIRSAVLRRLTGTIPRYDCLSLPLVSSNLVPPGQNRCVSSVLLFSCYLAKFLHLFALASICALVTDLCHPLISTRDPCFAACLSTYVPPHTLRNTIDIHSGLIYTRASHLSFRNIRSQ